MFVVRFILFLVLIILGYMELEKSEENDTTHTHDLYPLDKRPT